MSVLLSSHHYQSLSSVGDAFVPDSLGAVYVMHVSTLKTTFWIADGKAVVIFLRYLLKQRMTGDSKPDNVLL